MQQERRGNDDQRFLPPLNNYNQEVIKEDEEMEHKINLIGGSLQSAFLNRDEYEQQVAINQISDQDYEMMDQSDQNQQDGQQRRGYDLRSKFIPAKKVTRPNVAKKTLTLLLQS